MAHLYRSSSLEKLSDPEQLDRMITVSSPMSWLALIGIALVIAAAVAWSFLGTLPETVDVSGVISSPDNVCAEFSRWSGTVERLYIEEGADFSEGDKLADIKSGGNTRTITASSSGNAFFPLISVGDFIYNGTEIARYTPENASERLVVCYAPSEQVQQLKKDMRVLVYPAFEDKYKCGHLEAKVRFVGEYPASKENMSFVLGSGNSAAEQFTKQGSVTAVVCELKTDPAAESGYYWSGENGKELSLPDGAYISAKIVIDERAPIAKLFKTEV